VIPTRRARGLLPGTRHGSPRWFGDDPLVGSGAVEFRPFRFPGVDQVARGLGFHSVKPAFSASSALRNQASGLVRSK
jgi:hypothetical protein